MRKRKTSTIYNSTLCENLFKLYRTIQHERETKTILAPNFNPLYILAIPLAPHSPHSLPTHTHTHSYI